MSIERIICHVAGEILIWIFLLFLSIIFERGWGNQMVLASFCSLIGFIVAVLATSYKVKEIYQICIACALLLVVYLFMHSAFPWTEMLIFGGAYIIMTFTISYNYFRPL